jgi:hypothetical protein
VQPDDDTARIDTRIAWASQLPPGWTSTGTMVAGEDPDHPMSELRAYVRTGDRAFEVRVQLQPKGWNLPDDAGSVPVGKQPNGTTLVVMAHEPGARTAPSQAVLLEQAEHAIVRRPDADVSWIGQP